MGTFTTETLVRVYDDSRGWYVEIAPDSDGLGLCEISYHEGDDVRSIVIPWDMAERVGLAIGAVSKANNAEG